MFINSVGGVWFFPKENYCTNLNDDTNRLFYSTSFKTWSTAGRSKRIAPNLLGGW